MILAETLQLRMQMRLNVTVTPRRDGRMIALCIDNDFHQRVAKFSYLPSFSQHWVMSYAYQMALEGPR